MKKLIFASILGLFVLGGCTDESSSRRALTNEGYTDISFHGYDFFACSESDFYHTKFRAKNSKGMNVGGTVCCGLLFKNCTVRW